MAHFLVTGGCGFIGHHFLQHLIRQAECAKVTVLDNQSSGNFVCDDARVVYHQVDIANHAQIRPFFDGVDAVFHFAAIARTPWCIEDPLLCVHVNIVGTANVLEASRQAAVKRVVLSGSNVALAGPTLYRTSKQCVEQMAEVYHELYGLSVCALRYSNVYGKGQREDGIGPNVFAAFRMQKRANGKIRVTGDGEQTRDFTHVSDIVRANWLAYQSDYCGPALDICTGETWSMNQIVRDFFQCEIEHVADRPGDKKHIPQDPAPALAAIGYKFEARLPDHIKDCLDV